MSKPCNCLPAKDRDPWVLVTELEPLYDYDPDQLEEGHTTPDVILPSMDSETGIVSQFAARMLGCENEQGGGKASYCLGRTIGTNHWEASTGGSTQDSWLHFGYVQPVLLSQIRVIQHYWVGGIFLVEAKPYGSEDEWVEVYRVSVDSLEIRDEREEVVLDMQDDTVLTNEIKIYIFAGRGHTDEFASHGWCAEVYQCMILGTLPTMSVDEDDQRLQFVLECLEEQGTAEEEAEGEDEVAKTELSLGDCKIHIEGAGAFVFPSVLLLAASDRAEELRMIVKKGDVIEITEEQMRIGSTSGKTPISYTPSLVDSESLLRFFVSSSRFENPDKASCLELYAFFAALQCRREMFCICEIASQTLTDVDDLSWALVQADARFSDPIPSPLFQTLFDALRKHFEGGIPEDVARALGIWELFQEYESRTFEPLESHSLLRLSSRESRTSAETARLRALHEFPASSHDVTLHSIVDTGTASAHFVILLLRSSFFKTMFSFDGREKTEYLQTGIIKISELPTSALRALVLYLYTTEIPVLSLGDQVRLARFAEMYGEHGMLSAFVRSLCLVPFEMKSVPELRRAGLAECGFFQRVAAAWVKNSNLTLDRITQSLQ